MDRLDVQECTKDYLEASRELDHYETEYSSIWLLERASSTSDMGATHATQSTIGYKRNQLRAVQEIARVRMERAWQESKE